MHRFLRLAASALFVMAGPDLAAAQGKSIAQLAGDNANKRLVLEYLDLAWSQGKRAEARAKYFAPSFKNYPQETLPRAPTGAPPRPLGVKYEFHEAFAEGDYVVVHSMVRGVGIGEPVQGLFGRGGPKVGDDVIDIFKVVDGKIVGKSDTVQAAEDENLFISEDGRSPGSP
jgi:predicted SnoaL-like aldol condensation-catalyzing enzyme